MSLLGLRQGKGLHLRKAKKMNTNKKNVIKNEGRRDAPLAACACRHLPAVPNGRPVPGVTCLAFRLLTGPGNDRSDLNQGATEQLRESQD